MAAKVKIRILGRANSFNVRKVLWVCDELGLAFTREDWGRGYQPTSQPEFLAVNPIGLVPAVVLDDGTGLGDGTGAVSLRESNTIVRYLASRDGSDSLYPADLLQRARDRGRDGDCSPPPAQTRTGPIKASGSYLECLTAKRWLGQG